MKELILRKAPSAVIEDDRTELKRSNLCCKGLIDLMMECGRIAPEERPSMAVVFQALEELILQEFSDVGKLRVALAQAEGQDLDTYNEVDPALRSFA